MEGRGLSSEPTLKVGKDRRLGNLATPESVQRLQTAFHAKAKGEPEFRFYALYDKIYRQDVLEHAYACCRANKGAAGVDGLTFEAVEAYGRERWIGELAQQLREESYRPEAVRRVYIPKPNGKQRPLGIPRLADRVCQMAAMLILEPIFEADMPSEQYAYRHNRSAQDAVRRVHWLLTGGHRHVVDADLAGYFDTIPHAELMKSVARRIVDKRVLRLLSMWLDAPVEERDERGRKKRTTINRDSKRGIPQGSPISPLLSNLYMRRFILGWKRAGAEQRLGAQIVNYADDLVICCKGNNAAKALETMRKMMGQLKLTVNEEKDANVPSAGRRVRFSGIHLRSALRGEDQAALYSHMAVAEEHQAHDGGCTYPDRPEHGMDGCRRNGEMPESEAGRLDQLFQTWSCHESLSVPGQIHHNPAAPVAMQEAQAERRGL